VGEVVESGSWKVRVDGSRVESSSEGPRVVVDFTIKNDSDKTATLDMPSTAPRAPRRSQASFDEPPAQQDVQIAGPPPLSVTLLHRAQQSVGGGFLASDGSASGGYSFLAAPGDAIKLSFVFDAPASSAEPFALDLRFAGPAGGAHARVSLD